MKMLLVEARCPGCGNVAGEITEGGADDPWIRLPVVVNADYARELAMDSACDHCGHVGGTLLRLEPLQAATA